MILFVKPMPKSLDDALLDKNKGESDNYVEKKNILYGSHASNSIVAELIKKADNSYRLSQLSPNKNNKVVIETKNQEPAPIMTEALTRLTV
jgi:hypothetical protein